jgi:hypothetical protein
VKILERLRKRSPHTRSNPPVMRADLDGAPAMKPKIQHSPLDRADAARDERNELERLRDEARYRRERLELYRARLYGGRAVSQSKLRELQRASGRVPLAL